MVTTFKSFLAEKSEDSSYFKRTEVLHRDELIELLHGPYYINAKSAIKHGMLFRGDHFDHAYGMKPKRSGERPSLTGTALLKNWTKMHPAWRDVPPRDTSIFCSTSAYATAAFGDTFLVIPADAVDNFAEMEDDFNYVQLIGTNNSGKAHNIISYFYNLYGSNQRNDWYDWLDSTKSSEDFNRFFKEADKRLKTSKDGWSTSQLTSWIPGEANNTKDFFNKFFTPNAFGIELYGEYDQLDFSGKHEVWYEGDSLMIAVDVAARGDTLIRDAARDILKKLLSEK